MRTRPPQKLSLTDAELRPCVDANISATLDTAALVDAIAKFGSVRAVGEAAAVVMARRVTLRGAAVCTAPPGAMVAPALVEATASTLRLRLQAPATDGGDKLSALEVQVAAEGKQGDEAAFRRVHNGVRVRLRVVVCVSLRLCVLLYILLNFPLWRGGGLGSEFVGVCDWCTRVQLARSRAACCRCAQR